MTTIGGINPNFTGQPAGEPPYVRLPDPPGVFDRRAARFAVLAPGSEIAGYLAFLAVLARAQGGIAQAVPTPSPPDGVDSALANGMPPLPRDLAAAPGAASTLDALISVLATEDLAEGPRAIVASLAALSQDERVHMLQNVADGIFEIEKLGEGALVAAALQVWYAVHAVQLDVPRLRNLGETICPCCGGAPASSTIVIWPEAAGARYLTCSLCCAMWNHVRVKCTACGATKGISYRHVEGGTGEIAAEVCDTCRGYAKQLNRTKNAALDPVADDVASYGLDMMLRDDGWRRTGLNPFLILA